MKLYHEREQERGGGLDTRDEEECFSASGRLVGVWLTTEASKDPAAFTAEVDPDVVAAYETSGPEAAHRTFVVPGTLVATLGFVPG